MQEGAVGQAGERVVQRVVAHLVLVAQPFHRGRQDVRHGAQDGHLLVAEPAIGRDEHLVAGADPQPQRRRVDRPVRRERGAVGEAHLDALDGQRPADQRDRVGRELGGIGARKRSLAHRSQRPHALLGGAAPRDVAADRQQERALTGLHDAPAHLACELGAVAPQPPDLGREPQRVLGREVQAHVVRVAGSQPLGPEHLDRLLEELLAAVSEQLLRERVHEDDALVARDRDDGVGKPLENRRWGHQRVFSSRLPAALRAFRGFHARSPRRA